MGFFSIFQRRDKEERDNSFVTFDDVFPLTPNTPAGVSVDQNTALNLPAVWRCVSLNAETIASLPVDCFQKRGKDRVPVSSPVWLLKPSRDYSWFDFICEVQTSLELDGNAFILKVSANNGSRVAGLILLPPRQVKVERLGTGDKPLVYTLQNIDGTGTPYAANEILHIRAMTQPCQLRGMSPISYMALTIGTGQAAGTFAANFFGEGATLSGIIETPQAIRDEATAERLKEAFKKKHGGVSKSHAIGVLSGGAKFTPLSVNPEESQFLETQKFTAVQIASIFGVPPEYVTDAEGAKGYVTGLYARQMLWLQTGLLPRIKRLETAFSSLLPQGTYLKFNVDGLLRADPEQRAALMGAMIEHQAATPNEWRALEELNPLPGGDAVLQSVQFAPKETI